MLQPASACSICLPLNSALCLPSIGLSSSSDLWMGPSGQGNPRNGYLSTASSIGYQAFSPVSTGSDKSLKPPLGTPGVPGCDSSANQFPERWGRVSTRLWVEFKKHGVALTSHLTEPQAASSRLCHRCSWASRWTLLRKIPIRMHFSGKKTRKNFSSPFGRSRGTRNLPSDATLDTAGGGASPPQSHPEASAILLSGRRMNT